MFKILALILLVFGSVLGVGSSSAHAQNVTCPTRPPGDSTNACASTAFVNQAGSGASGLSVLSFGAVSDCLNGPSSFQYGGTGACTDDTAAFVNTIAAAKAAGTNIIIPCGNYYIANPNASSIVLGLYNTSDTTFTNQRPSILGGGSRCTFIYIGPGNFSGLIVQGTASLGIDAQTSQQTISGFTLIKSDYQGYGLTLSDLSNVNVIDVLVTGFYLGCYAIGVQQSVLKSVQCTGNQYGAGIVEDNSVTTPDSILCLNCYFTSNAYYGLELENPTVFTMIGGDITENGHAGGLAAWGARVIYTNTIGQLDANVAATFQGVYFERNQGIADIIYSNKQNVISAPVTLNLRDNTFDRLYNVIGANVTISNGANATVGFTAHGFPAGQKVIFSSTGSLPTGITAGQTYYVISTGLTANAFEISATAGGSAVTTSSAGSGTFTVYSQTINVLQVDTAYNQPTVFNLSGNGFGGLQRGSNVSNDPSQVSYVPSTVSPYISVVDPSQPVKFCMTGNRWSDYQEVGNLFLDSCDFADIDMDMGSTTTVRRASNIQLSGTYGYTRLGTGNYKLYWAYPAITNSSNTQSLAFTMFSASTPGYALIAAYTSTYVTLQYYNLSGTPTDATNFQMRVMN